MTDTLTEEQLAEMTSDGNIAASGKPCWTNTGRRT